MTAAYPEQIDAPEWFERWFGEEYLEIYPHRDRNEAERAVATVLDAADLSPGTPALDLACGAGRHVAALREQGVAAVGLDLSEVLLRRAAGDGLPVVRGDMRDLPVRSASLGLLTSFFTSFGYFDDPADDARVLREARRVLRSGAWFAWDYLHAARVRAELRPRDEREVNGRRVVQTRTLSEGGQRVEKRIEIHRSGEGPPEIFYERVRLYEPAEFRNLLAEAGLRTRVTLGDYGGGALEPHSPRVLLIGTAA